MIERIYTSKLPLVSATSTLQFKLLAILLIVKYCKSLSVEKLQLYLWGLEERENIDMIKAWKKQKSITNLSWVADEDINPLIMQCVANGLLKYKKSNHQMKILLDLKADSFLHNVSNLSIYKEINDTLKEIGRIYEKLLKNVELSL